MYYDRPMLSIYVEENGRKCKIEAKKMLKFIFHDFFQQKENVLENRSHNYKYIIRIYKT